MRSLQRGHRVRPSLYRPAGPAGLGPATDNGLGSAPLVGHAAGRVPHLLSGSRLSRPRPRRRPTVDKQSGPTVAAGEPVVQPDDATAPHPVTPAAGQAPSDVPAAGEGVLQEALPA